MRGKRKRIEKVELVNIIRRIFEVVGIEITGELIITRTSLGEGIIRDQRIHSLNKFIELFSDGIYVIEGYDVTIKGVDQEPFSITYICIDADYRENEWTVTLRTDEEEIFTSEISTIEAREIEIVKVIQLGLSSLTAIINFAHSTMEVLNPPSS